MTRFFLTTASLMILAGVGAVGASAANIAQPAPGTVLYGLVHSTPPAGMVAPAAPAGYHYEWVYGYSREGLYKAHWEAVRNS
jgi:hypothetical protein